jgi:hypothetical protein
MTVPMHEVKIFTRLLRFDSCLKCPLLENYQLDGMTGMKKMILANHLLQKKR